MVVRVATGEVVQQIEYDEFGKVLTNTNPDFQPFGFAGGLAEDATGLVRFGRRDYDPNTGRFITRDPVGLAGGLNAYTYARNQPVHEADPTGELPLPLVTGAIGAGAGLLGNLAGQLWDNGGNFRCLDWSNAGIAAGVGFAAGAAAPYVATTRVGAAFLGAGANMIQYYLSQKASNQSMSISGFAWSAASGALGGLMGGTVTRGNGWDQSASSFLNRNAARQLNDEMAARESAGATNLVRNLSGSSVSSTNWPPSFGAGAAKCKEKCQ
jgi:RHS repeat-associated protein